MIHFGGWVAAPCYACNAMGQVKPADPPNLTAEEKTFIRAVVKEVISEYGVVLERLGET